MIELPLDQVASQRFTIQLGSTKFSFTINWNDRAEYFTLKMVEEGTDETILEGVPVILGCDLLEPFNYGIGSLLVVDTSGRGEEAAIVDLGVRTQIYWFSPEEVNAIDTTV